MANPSSIKSEAEQKARRTDWIETFARVGYTAKGIVYSIIGILALQTALGTGGQTGGARNAIREISQQPFGQVLLVLTALGLACYAVWRLTLATLDVKQEGSDIEGLVKRIGYAASGFINLGLALAAARIVTGSGGGGGQASKQELTARLMAQPFGIWLVGLAGAVVIGVGLYHFRRAYQASFMRKYAPGEMRPTQRTWARRIGRMGITARGITFAMIGAFLIQAAWQTDPSETKGLGGAFQTLLEQPYGPWLLGVVAAGFVCYGIYCFSAARYRRFQTDT